MAEPAGRGGLGPRFPALSRRLGSVRVRAALAAMAVVAVVLAIAAVAFVALLRRQLDATLTEVAELEAAEVVRDGAVAEQLLADERAPVQVLTRAGDVVASSPALAGEPPLVDERPAPGRQVVLHAVALPVAEDEPFTVVVRGVEGRDGGLVVISAQSREGVERATEVLVRLMALGAPLVLLFVAGTSFWLTGLALAPVEAMRRRVAGITATDLTARVPEPPTDDEVGHLATTMNAMLDRLAAAAEAQRRFVADASHELRSPLATIRAAHEVAAVHPEATDWSTVNADVLAELQRLERLVDDLLFLARTDEHGPLRRPEDVDLDDLVGAEAERLRHTTRLEVVVRAAPVRVVGDRSQLARVLRNLTDNAARHAAGRVELRLRSDGPHAVVDVVDDGPGIPVAERERVFQRFVRLDPSRQRGAGGAGLGLAIAQELARAHDGEVSVVDSADGAHLRLCVPLAGAEAPDTRARAAGSVHPVGG